MPITPNVSSERVVLADIYQRGSDAFIDVCDVVSESSFTVDSNRFFFRCAKAALELDPATKFDLLTVKSTAASINLSSHFDASIEERYLGALANTVVHPGAGKRHAVVVRELVKCADSLGGVAGNEPLRDILGLAEGPIFELTSKLERDGGNGVVRMGAGGLAYVRDLMDHPRKAMGIATGLQHYDDAIGGGLRENALDFIVARQKTGKTLLADNVAIFVARQKIHVLNVDTEMTQFEHLIRIYGNMAQLDLDAIEKGDYAQDAERRRRLEAAAVELDSLPYDYLPAGGMEFEDVLAAMRRWVVRTVGLTPEGKANPCVIIYDWLKLGSSSSITRNVAEHQQLGFICSELKNFQTKYGSRCLCFGQMNRDGIDTEDTSVVRGSDRITDVCTSLTIFKEKGVDEMALEAGRKARYSHKLVVLASRFGPKLARDDYINIRTVYSQGRVEEGPLALSRASLEAGNGGEIVLKADPDESVPL